MSLLIPDADVPFDITRLGHVVLTSVNLDRTRLFYETGLGLQVTGHTPERLHLRGNEETAPHSLGLADSMDGAPGRHGILCSSAISGIDPATNEYRSLVNTHWLRFFPGEHERGRRGARTRRSCHPVVICNSRSRLLSRSQPFCPVS